MQNKLVFVTLPLIETMYPLPAYAALKPVINRCGLDCELFDFNLELRDNCTDDEFAEINAWCMFARGNITDPVKAKFLAVFDRYFGNFDPQWLALSVFSFYSARPAALLLEHLAQQRRDYKIVLGGNGCTSRLEQFQHKEFGVWCLDQKLCDFVIFSEGEMALQSLLQGHCDYPGINNSTNFEQIKNLDQLDYPDYSGIDWSRYYDPRIMITGSRGCVRHCTFCDIGLSWPKFSYRSAEKIVEEMRIMVHEHGIIKFEFTDSLINGSIKNFNRFNELLIDLKARDPAMQDVTYKGQFICRNQNSQDQHMYELMHHAGCQQITVGIESFSERVRYHMKKKFSDADIDHHFEQCGRWRIPNILLLIVGYPTETQQDHEANLRALYRYKKYSDMGIIFMARWGLTMHLFEGTPISDMREELGINIVDMGQHDSVFNWVSSANAGLDLSERISRRLEIHETSMKLGYAMPNCRKELTTLLTISGTIQPRPESKKIFMMQSQ